ncbi:hypothetical protein LX83_000486 [Goodfellowiella coeruleoviolacea]|uniref:Uncharacterized protein n=1 Tax=Goodfellowiella coeruleoviolacea TaxID=334858 RepID=A0AAE3G8G6_9PSEU|nr:hypothetical protein [Goodfellowiella coeruleoviolacea]
MDAKIVDQRCILTLTREDAQLIASAISVVNEGILSDELYQIRVGWSRGEVSILFDQLSSLAEAIPSS